MEGKKKKAISKNPNDIAPDMLASFLLSIITVCVLVKPLGERGLVFWWWFPFIILNIAYIGYGIRKGWANGDPANGLVVASGPIAFYAWTYVMVWRKYFRKYFKKGDSR